MLADAGALLAKGCDTLVRAFAQHAIAHWETPRVGRTHGIHAAPTTWGHRVAGFVLAAERARQRIEDATDAAALAKISGPVGTYAHVAPEVERLVARSLELTPVDVATQVIMRDRLATWVFELASVGSICEAFALEVRHGQRTEVTS
jgi:adenylosuccinate lyase